MMSPLFGQQKSPRSFQIWVKYNEESPSRVLYTGQWNAKALTVWNANSDVFERRRRTVVTQDDADQEFRDHPELRFLDIYLDKFYVVEGDPNDPPNRLSDPIRLRQIPGYRPSPEAPPTDQKRTRYFVDNTGWVYRWKDGELTYIEGEGHLRVKSGWPTLDSYLEQEGDDYGARELRTREVPEWAL